MSSRIRVPGHLLSRWKSHVIVVILSGAAAGLTAGVLIGILQRAAAASPPPVELGAAFVVAFVARSAFNLVSRLAQVRMMHHFVLPSRRVELVRRFLGADLRALERASDARLIGALTLDTAHAGFAAEGWLHVVRGAMAMLACAAYMLWLSRGLFLLTLAAIAAGAVVVVLVSKRAQHRAEIARRAEERATKRAEDLVLGVKELKRSRAVRDDFLARAFEPDIRELHHEQASSAALQALGASWMSTLLLATVGLLLFAHPAAVPHGAITGYAFALVYLGAEITTLAMWVPHIRTGELAFASVEGLELEPEATKPAAESEPRTFEALSLRGVTHSYDRASAEFALGPLDFQLAPGEVVFFVGGNGSGKSTLAKLVLGLYPSSTGEVRLDDRLLESDEYRERFTAILAKWHLFDRLYGLEDENVDERANAFIEKLRLGKKVSVKDGAFSTLNLSLGQRKRLALVTALLEDRPIYVFDEWAADQDPEFKETFYRSFLPELKQRKKAAIVITHDERYFDVADRVVRLARGKIVAS